MPTVPYEPLKIADLQQKIRMQHSESFSSNEESLTALRQRLSARKMIPPSISPVSSSNSSLSEDGAPKDRRFDRAWALMLYSLTTILLFSDQNLLAPNLSAAAEEFGFNDEEKDSLLGGQIALAFFVVGAPASFLVGCCADSKGVSRNVLFGVLVLIGEGSCLVTYWTTTYTGLYITRALTGFSVGGALPLLSSVLGDWYPPSERAKVMANLGVGTGMGIAFGQAISGWIGPAYGWRMPFLVVSVPALVVAVLIMTTVVDPKRGESDLMDSSAAVSESTSEEEETRYTHIAEQEESLTENNAQSSPSSAPTDDPRFNHQCQSPQPTSLLQRIQAVLKTLLAPTTYTPHLRTTQILCSTPSVLLTLLQGAPGCIPWGIVNTFLNDYLSKDCGLSVQAATTVILVFGVGNFFGVLLGGWGGSALYVKDVRFPNVLAGTMAIIGCIPLWILINTTHVEQYDDDGVESLMSIGQAIFVFFIAFLAGLGSGVTGPIVKATLQNVTLPHQRGQAFALLNTFDDFGRGLGPVFVAFMISGMGGRLPAFNVGISGWVLCGILNIALFWTIKSDEVTRERLFRLEYIDHGNETESSMVEESRGIV